MPHDDPCLVVASILIVVEDEEKRKRCGFTSKKNIRTLGGSRDQSPIFLPLASIVLEGTDRQRMKKEGYSEANSQLLRSGGSLASHPGSDRFGSHCMDHGWASEI